LESSFLFVFFSSFLLLLFLFFRNMEGLDHVKKELKQWERTFKEQQGRKPTLEDIEADPAIGLSPL